MPVVNVKIGDRDFQLACGDGQEGHLRNLASQLNEKVTRISGKIHSNNDTMLYLMAALMTQDELNEANQGTANTDAEKDYEIDMAVADAINTISEYVETVAERVEKA